MKPKVTVTIENGQLAGRVFEFGKPQSCLVGRSPECDLALPQSLEFGAISRKHLILDINPPAVLVRDAGSRNGTHLNGMEIGRPAAWHLDRWITPQPCVSYGAHDGDELRIGETSLRIHTTPPSHRSCGPGAPCFGAKEVEHEVRSGTAV
jgi:eukaryotic-like serine/threonine-protein kinase